MDSYVFHTFLLIYAIIKQNIGQNKKHWHNNNIRMEKNNQLKNVGIKPCMGHFVDDILKFKILISIFYWMNNQMKMF